MCISVHTCCLALLSVQVEMLRAALPPSAAPGASENGVSMDLDDNIEDVRMTPVGDIEEELKSRARFARSGGGEAYDEDDEVRA
jgi:hypothetical protein